MCRLAVRQQAVLGWLVGQGCCTSLLYRLSTAGLWIRWLLVDGWWGGRVHLWVVRALSVVERCGLDGAGLRLWWRSLRR